MAEPQPFFLRPFLIRAYVADVINNADRIIENLAASPSDSRAPLTVLAIHEKILGEAAYFFEDFAP